MDLMNYPNTPESMDSDSEPVVPSRLSTVGEVRRALHPLQAQADRVGRQVEQLAETLDQLSSLRDSQLADCAQVLPIVQEWEKIASDTVKRLKRRHSDEKKQFLREKRRKINNGAHASSLALYNGDRDVDALSTTVNDLLHWEQERQTWELLSLMLQVHYPVGPESMSASTSLQQPRDAPLHAYSSDHAVYQNYLAADNSAWEKHVILEWLARSANESGESLEDMVADSSTGPATNGWLHSKEAIKADKRLRSWAYSITPELLVVSGTLVNPSKLGNSGKEPFVTHMDPDAVTRQGRDLKKEDLAFEQITWFGCWELLRRGKPWSEIEDWCQQCSEGWRAISVRGDPRLGKSKDCAGGSLAGRARWQQVCVQLARNGGIDDYERAVYGLLGGDEHSVSKVCKSWDDYLHAWINCQLAQNYSFYFCEQFGLKPVMALPDSSSMVRQSLASFIDRLSTQEQTAQEALAPVKLLQAGMMKNSLATHLRNQGLQLTEQLQGAQYGFLSAKASQRSNEKREGQTSPLSLDDYDLVRMLAHVLIIYQHFDSRLRSSPATENIIVAFVDFLGRAGKQQLLPLYASYLSEDRSVICMARQLPFIKDTSERQVIVRLMRQYGLDEEMVLLAQLDSIISALLSPSEFARDFPKLDLLDKPSSDFRDVRPLKRDMAGDHIELWEEDLIDSLEWFLLLDGDARFTIYPAGAVVYKHLLRSKSYAAIKKLATTVNSERISQVVPVPSEAGAAIPETDGDDMQTGEHSHKGGEVKARNDRDTDLADMKIFQDLESFAILLDALDTLEQIIHAGTGARVQAHEGNKGALKVWKRELQAAHNAVVESMQPLLQGWLLPTKGKTESEMQELHRLRVCTLPELVLAYLSVLSFAGTWLNRENLLECMNLAKEIADEDKDLCKTFIDAGRMAELMTTMANISRQILAAQETTGGIKMKKRRGGGELLDIWSVNADREG